MEQIIVVVSGGLVDEVYCQSDMVEVIVIDLDLVGEEHQVTSEAHVRTLRCLPEEYQRIIDDDEYLMLPYDGLEKQSKDFSVDNYILVTDSNHIEGILHSVGYKVQDTGSLLVAQDEGVCTGIWFASDSIICDTTWFYQLNFK